MENKLELALAAVEKTQKVSIVTDSDYWKKVKENENVFNIHVHTSIV